MTVCIFGSQWPVLVVVGKRPPRKYAGPGQGPIQGGDLGVLTTLDGNFLQLATVFIKKSPLNFAIHIKK